MKIALIANPYAGGKKAGRYFSETQQHLIEKEIDCQTFFSRYPGHILEIASQLDIDRYDAVVAMGGDGTNFQMINGLAKSHDLKQTPPLGIIPIGSGNSFAKDLNIHSIEDGIQAIAEYKSQWVDVCSYSQDDTCVYFINLMGLGFVTNVAATAEKFKIFRELSYLIGIFHRIVNLSYPMMEIEVDGKTIKGRNCFIEFCNSRYTGGDMLMAPDAKIDDGFMDIIIAGKFSRSALLTTLPKLYKGTHVAHPLVTVLKAKTVRLIAHPPGKLLPDGELSGSSPTTVKVHHRLTRYLKCES